MPAASVVRESFESAKDAKRVLENHCQEIHDFILPEGEDFTISRTAGSKRRPQVLDNTGEQSSETMATGLHGIITGPASNWGTLRTKDPELNDRQENAAFLQAMTRVTWAHFASAQNRFHAAAAENYTDLVNYGNDAMFIAEVPRLGPLFMARPFREIYWHENERGVVDTVFRHFRPTARQAVAEFPKNAGAKVMRAATDPKRANERFDFVHMTAPRDERSMGGFGPKNMPFASVYLNMDDNVIVGEGGFPEFPWACGRWQRNAGDPYARSAGMKALPDVKMLQRMMKSTIRAAEQTIKPALMAPDDGVFGTVTMVDGHINTVRADLMNGPRDPIRPIQTGGRPDLGESVMEPVRDRVRRAFFNHLLRMFEDPRLTATQVLQEVEEQLRLIGPYLGRLQTEKWEPAISRTVAILFRAGKYSRPPADLARGVPLEVEFQSPIARAQRLTEARAISATFDLLAPVFQIQPEIADNFDGDALARRVGQMFDFPLDTMRPSVLVRQIREGRAEAAQAEAQKQDAMDAAGGLSKLVPALNGVVNQAAA